MEKKKKKAKKIKYPHTILYLSDLHVPYHDEAAIKMALEYASKKGIDEVILSELPDFYKVSKWRKDPKRMPFAEEVKFCREMLADLTKNFEDQRKTYLVGNHEERLENYVIDNAKELDGLEELTFDGMMRVTENGWDLVDNKLLLEEGEDPLTRGNLTFIHGHEVKVGWSSINLAKIYYERCRENVVVGHHHRAQEWIVRKLNGQHEGSWLVGCMCKLNPEYMPHNDWVHGFAIIEIYDERSFSVLNKKIINGRVL